MWCISQCTTCLPSSNCFASFLQRYSLLCVSTSILSEGGEQVFGSTDLALKSARIVDLCCKSRGFTDFENTADRGSAVTFEADSGLCLSYVRTLGPKGNLDRKSFFSLDRYVNEFIQIITFFERTSFYLRCETVIGIVLCCCHQACCLLYYFGKINSGIYMYQFSFEPLHLFSDVVVVSDLNKNFGGLMDLVKKRHGSADLHTSIHPPPVTPYDIIST